MTAAALLLSGPAGAVPSGRVDYRSPDDYPAEIAALAAAHPGPRPRRLDRQPRCRAGRSRASRSPTPSPARDDGRPVHVELGLTHAREWTSGETVMEFARELATSDEPRLARLRARSRTFLFPVVNPDGFLLSKTALPAQRKNAAGVDLNRNFGAFWGGPGASEDPLSELYRGPAPFSEPESQALRAWGSAHQVMVVNSLHSYGGSVLHQPGFARDEPRLPAAPRCFGRRFGARAAWRRRPATSRSPPTTLCDITGAAEDWNYFNQFAFAYTTEIGVRDHQVPFGEWSTRSTPACAAAMVHGRRGGARPRQPRRAARPRAGRPHAARCRAPSLVHRPLTGAARRSTERFASALSVPGVRPLPLARQPVRAPAARSAARGVDAALRRPPPQGRARSCGQVRRCCG